MLLVFYFLSLFSFFCSFDYCLNDFVSINFMLLVSQHLNANSKVAMVIQMVEGCFSVVFQRFPSYFLILYLFVVFVVGL